MAPRRSSVISLSVAVYGFVVLGAITFGMLAAYLLFDRIEKVQSAALEEAVYVRGQHAAHDLAFVLEREWSDLKGIAAWVGRSGADELQGALEAAVGDGTRVAWAGFVTPDGIVKSASGNLLEGADAASLIWFQQGLGGDFAGDIRDAMLVNNILGGTDENPLRFIDLATRVERPDGQVAGVIAFNIHVPWVEKFLAETADSLGLDLYLVNQSGDVIIATDGSEQALRGTKILRAAASGIAQSGREIWPDGKEYFNVAIPSVTYGDLPSFGWRLVARISPNALNLASSDLRRALLAMLAVAGTLLLIGTAAFNRIFIHPISLLAENAKRIADGSDEYPLELQRTMELATLSAALAQMQGRMD